MYVEEGLSGKRNRTLLARDSNTCDLSQKSHTHCNCKPFFSGLSTPAGLRCPPTFNFRFGQLPFEPKVQKSLGGKLRGTAKCLKNCLTARGEAETGHK